MTSTDSKMRSITGELVTNMLAERENGFTYKVTYVANRTIEDLCKLAAQNGSKFSIFELKSAYNDLSVVTKQEVYSAPTVEFGFTNSSFGVGGSFIRPKTQFDPSRNSVVLWSPPRAEIKEDMKGISVIVSAVEGGLSTIINVTDVSTGTQDGRLTPDGGLVGTGNRTETAGEEDKAVGFLFVNARDETETAVPMTSLIRNDPSAFSLIISVLADGPYYLEATTQYGGNNKFSLEEIRRNRSPCPLSVGTGDPDSESPDEIWPWI